VEPSDISQIIRRLDVEIQVEKLPELLVSNEINPEAWSTMFLHACLIKRSIIHSISFGDILVVKARAGKVSGGRAHQHQRLKFPSHLSMAYIGTAATVSSDAYSALHVLKPAVLSPLQFRLTNTYEVHTRTASVV
jgi:hypothetical protein